MTASARSPQDRHELAEISAQLNAVPPLDSGELADLLAQVRVDETSPARQRLVEQYLRVAFDEARRRTGRGVDIGDLYQEGTLAVIAAVHEYAQRDRPASGLAGFTERVVAAHLDATVEAAELEHRGEEAFVRDAQLYETAEVGLRHRLGREATTTEIASLLEWPAERVETMAGMLHAARELYDSEIVQYLDDE